MRISFQIGMFYALRIYVVRRKSAGRGNKMQYSILDNDSVFCYCNKLYGTLLKKFGYELLSSDKSELNVKITYVNNQTQRKVVISNACWPTDYGFSIFIYNLITDKYNIIVNVPWNKEDRDNLFILKSFEFIKSNEEIQNILSGKVWIDYSSILYKIEE